jgi:hypothetical protein
MPQPMLQPILQPTLLLTLQATSLTMQPMLPLHSQMSPPTKDKMLEPNLRHHKLTTLKAINVDV